MGKISRWVEYKDRIIQILEATQYNASPRGVARQINNEEELNLSDYEIDLLRTYVKRKQQNLRSRHKLPKNRTTDEVLKSRIKSKPSKGSKSWDEKEDTAIYEYKGERSIRTLEEALEFSDVDLDKWEVERHIFNSWDVSMKNQDGSGAFKRTNYQVKVWFRRKKASDKEILDEFYKRVSKKISNNVRSVKKVKSKKKVGVIPIADMHIGAYIRELIVTKDFDIDTVSSMLNETADEINSEEYSEVHIAILGDIIESFTGGNHANSFKSIGYGHHGFTVFTLAYEMIENFLLSINNLKAVYLVSGNHDRYTSSNKEDTKGEVLQGISYFLNKFLDVDVEYNPLVVSKTIDGINYIFTHGHHRFSSKNPEKIILDYGDSSMYNLILKGHDHTRRKQETLVRESSIIADTANYRMLVCPSFFTGNFYSESNGWSSLAGFYQFYSKNGKPKMIDTPL